MRYILLELHDKSEKTYLIIDKKVNKVIQRLSIERLAIEFLSINNFRENNRKKDYKE